MSRLKVSIALATWNGEAFLREQLESYLHQSRLPDELVVSDDNSRDGTMEILCEFARQAPFPVKISRNQQRLGYAKNFEKAIETCSGDVILLSDQDDIWLPGHIERLVMPFEAHSSGRSTQLLLTLSRSKHFRICEDGSRIEWDIARSRLRRWNWRVCDRDGLIAGFVRHWQPPFAGHGTAFSARVRLAALPVATDCHDFWIDSIASALGDFVYIDEVLTLHRVHEKNTAGYGHKKRGLARIYTPRRFDKEIKRYEDFVNRLEALSDLPERGRRSLAVAKRAIVALKRRQLAHGKGMAGIWLCAGTLLRGDYHVAGLGIYSFLKDVIDLVRTGARGEPSRK